jgi:hypothetical protein
LADRLVEGWLSQQIKQWLSGNIIKLYSIKRVKPFLLKKQQELPAYKSRV